MTSDLRFIKSSISSDCVSPRTKTWGPGVTSVCRRDTNL
jgi:hypothetical protein